MHFLDSFETWYKDPTHTELQRSRIKKDEQAVSSIVDLIQGWVNPFSESQDLVSISTAKKAPSGGCHRPEDSTRGWRKVLRNLQGREDGEDPSSQEIPQPSVDKQTEDVQRHEQEEASEV